MSAVSGSLAAAWSSDAQNNATEQGAANVRNTNRANEALYLMSRGAALSEADCSRLGLPTSLAGQSSAILPYYMPEVQLGGDASAVYAAETGQDFASMGVLNAGYARQNYSAQQVAQMNRQLNKINDQLERFGVGRNGRTVDSLTPQQQARYNSLLAQQQSLQNNVSLIPAEGGMVYTDSNGNVVSPSQAVRSDNPFSDKLQNYQDIVGQFTPSEQATQKTAADLADGSMTSQMLDEQQSVAQSRLDLASSEKNAALEQLQSTLNEIDAVQARRGFSGDSLGSRLTRFNAGSAIARQGAKDLGEAKVQNATDRAAIQQQGRQMQLANLDLPERMAGNALGMANLPNQALTTAYQTALGPSSNFVIGRSNAPEQNTFIPSATQPWMSSAALATGSAASSVGNYFAQQGARNGWGSGGGSSTSFSNGYTGSTTTSPSGTTMVWSDAEI